MLKESQMQTHNRTRSSQTRYD